MSMYSPKEIAQNYSAYGVAKTKLPIPKMILLAILAGMFIGLAGVGATIVPATLYNNESLQSLGKLLGALVFPTGLVMVLLAGSELWTGNCLIIIPVLQKEVKLRAMFRNWIFVYIGNFIGGLIVAALTVYGGTFKLFDGAAGAYLIDTAVMKVTMPWHEALFRGIYCNFLVCVAVWIAFAAKDIAGKVIGLFFPIMLFVASGYEHSIANMFFIPGGLFAKDLGGTALLHLHSSFADLGSLTWGAMFTNNLIPATLGNIIGGMVMVGIVYWYIYLREGAQKVVAKVHHKKKKKK